jgi:WD40 repeat protein
MPGTIRTYDVEAETLAEISLPEPIITADLANGLSPDGQILIVRAGSPLNTDELGLYRVDLMTGQTSQLTPLLNLDVQRKIVNETGTRAFDTLRAVTRDDSLAWSPDGRFLAFTAALNTTSSDLYVWDPEKDQIDRLNGLYSHSASPYWSPGSNWLVAQDLGDFNEETGWRVEAVSGLQIPGFNNQSTLYLPDTDSRGEVFVGWLSAQSLMSYSLTAEGPKALRQVNLETHKATVNLAGAFMQAAVDPTTGAFAYALDAESAAEADLIGGVYLVLPGSASPNLIRAGSWPSLTWDPGGMFLASGSQGLLAFTSDGQSIHLPEERQARLSPSGNWIVAWGTADDTSVGARLYQSPSGTQLQSLTDLPVSDLCWQPDSKGFFILADGSLYHLVFPGLNPVEIASGFSEDEVFIMAWAAAAAAE